jgi:hypothetical protein
MHKDPIVEAVRRVKEARAKRYNYDIRAMVRALRVNQRKNRERLVTLSPKRPATVSKSWQFGPSTVSGELSKTEKV